jgi:hypothetical protein
MPSALASIGPGGLGGEVTTTNPVTGGQQLQISVGQRGSSGSKGSPRRGATPPPAISKPRVERAVATATPAAEVGQPPRSPQPCPTALWLDWSLPQVVAAVAPAATSAGTTAHPVVTAADRVLTE